MPEKFDYDKPVTNCPACKSEDLEVVMRYLEKDGQAYLEEGVHCRTCDFSFSGIIAEKEESNESIK
jgi:predicted Zn-ribbon and HTH transcriptional regulator